MVQRYLRPVFDRLALRARSVFAPTSCGVRVICVLRGNSQMDSLSEPAQVGANGFRVSLLTDQPGLIEVPGQEYTRVSIHAGPPVEVSCHRAGHYHCGTSAPGDIHIIPADTPSVWDVKGRDTFLTLSVSPSLLNRVAKELGHDPDGIEIRNRFQVRDTQLENIGWALKEEMECGYPCGQLYFDDFDLRPDLRRPHDPARDYNLAAGARTGGRRSFDRDRRAFHFRRVFELSSGRQRSGAVATNTAGRGRGSDRAQRARRLLELHRLV